jgi:hypothetical protein
MQIFVDESGPFVPLNGAKSRVSCVGALCTPDALHDRLREDWLELKAKEWPDSDEVKGSALDEDAIIKVLSLIRKHDVVFDTCCIDAGLHFDSDVEEFKTDQAARIGKDLPPDLSDSDRAMITELQHLSRTLSNQEFIQAFLTITLLERLVPLAANYYAQRRPKELAHFHWTVDAKGKDLVAVERFWTHLILPALQWYSETHPAGFLPFGDYSHFERHRLEARDELGETARVVQKTGNQLLNSGRIYREHLAFADSRDHVGLQLVDVLVNATARALNGRLQEPAWSHIGRVMILQKPSPLRLVSLRALRYPNGTPVPDHYQRVSVAIYRSAKPMVAKMYRSLLRKRAGQERNNA